MYLLINVDYSLNNNVFNLEKFFVVIAIQVSTFYILHGYYNNRILWKHESVVNSTINFIDTVNYMYK